MGRVPADAAAAGGAILTRPTVLAWLRHGIALVAGFIAGTRGISAISAWRAWHDLAPRDPSGADLYRTATLLDLGIAAVCLALAGLAWWVLRPPKGAPLP